VTTPAFKDGADTPFENTQYKGNVFPGLAWPPGPAGTKSYAIIMQDTDGMMRSSNGLPILHWTMGNIPSSFTKLDAGMANAPEDSSHGQSYRGANQPYLGPRTPAGPKHRYHFQVFALDALLPSDAFGQLRGDDGSDEGARSCGWRSRRSRPDYAVGRLQLEPAPRPRAASTPQSELAQ
jgi:Raf kinase inhibitor-like YbhB/YbcL family protein